MKFLVVMSVLFTMLALGISLSGEVIWGLWIMTGICFYLPITLITVIRARWDRRIVG